MRKRAFTLIELLVVIAIIAILAAILFPVFAQAKLAANKISSLSNAKELDLAAIMYSNDHDDTYATGSGYNWWYPSGCGDGAWVIDTQPYIKNTQILRDSADSDGMAWWPTWMGSGVTEISYASNGYILQNPTDNPANSYNRGIMMMAQGADVTSTTGTCQYQGWLDVSTTTTTAVTQPAATIMYASRYGGQNIWGLGDMMAGVVPSWDTYGMPNAIPNGLLAPNTPYVVNDGRGAKQVNADQRNGAVACPFANQGIFTFADGHAKTMNPVATNPHPNAVLATPDQSNMWDAKR